MTISLLYYITCWWKAIILPVSPLLRIKSPRLKRRLPRSLRSQRKRNPRSPSLRCWRLWTLPPKFLKFRKLRREMKRRKTKLPLSLYLKKKLKRVKITNLKMSQRWKKKETPSFTGINVMRLSSQITNLSPKKRLLNLGRKSWSRRRIKNLTTTKPNCV